MDPTLGTHTDGRPALRFERHLKHAPEVVWRAITDPDQLNAWYPIRALIIDLRIGGRIDFDGMHAVVTQLDPPKVFAFSEHAPPEMHRESDDLIHFELTPDGDGCRLVFTHVFDDRPAAASYGSGWTVCLNALVAAVNGEEVRMERPSDQHHEQLIHQFGLDQGSVTPIGDGYEIRFSRQLTRPIDVVQAALGDLATDAHIELSAGTGHGARLELTRTVASADQADLDGWRQRINDLVRRITAD
ncbi:SRPBCC family protein [Kutzneria chonburiensis]|uniref:SRPBCC family protein n=1 Tax=Kutzneria chonburiensis TaxID=1483604 RepID=A0ABV6MS53_9PSEU|nr:SRPBCC family protein [Kutzneria chonburiensis]